MIYAYIVTFMICVAANQASDPFPEFDPYDMVLTTPTQVDR